MMILLMLDALIGFAVGANSNAAVLQQD